MPIPDNSIPMLTRRRLLAASALAAAAAGLPAGIGQVFATSTTAPDLSAANAALQRVLPAHAQQIVLRALQGDAGSDSFRIEAAGKQVAIAGSSTRALLAGVHWYLKYVANAHVSWAGTQLDLPERLPLPQQPIAVSAQLPHRYLLNDTDDGYSGPYRDWAEWERLLDVAALQGSTEMLLTIGQEAVYHRALQEFGYSDTELRAWIPAPAHQPWWLLQNMSGFGGPVSPALLDARIALGARIAARMRELGIAPVFPGYFGTVPTGFATRNAGARTIPQGKWVGFDRPDWLDPTGPVFAELAASFYRHQRELFGNAHHFKIDLLHEGGKHGDVDVTAAARAVQTSLDAAHPEAIWVILGWQKNPTAQMIAGVDKARMLAVDGLADRYTPAPDRERDWQQVPYAFGSIANFGGHTTLGAKAQVWLQRFYAARARPGNALRGIAWMPEGGYRDAAAMELFNELAWRATPITDLPAWFAGYARFRYGGEDAHARKAWQALARSVYRLDLTEYTEPPDSLFGARPGLDVTTAAAWSPETIPYDSKLVDDALRALLQVAPALRDSDAYRLDVVDIARQCLANHGRALLPKIKSAFDAKQREQFDMLSTRWLDCMRLSEKLLATHQHFLLGPWLASARAAGADDAERKQLEYDARSILTVWGPRAASDGAKLHDYANREWAGLMGSLYLQRWQRFFAGLATALDSGSKPDAIDWFAMEDAWARGTESHPLQPQGDSHAVATEVLALLDAAAAG